MVGVTPSGYASATVVYGTKNSDVMQKNQENMYSENGTARTDVELPPDLYYGSDQYAVCNNYQLEKGRDLSYPGHPSAQPGLCPGGPGRQELLRLCRSSWAKTCPSTAYPFKVVGVYAEKDPDSAYGPRTM